MRKTLLITVLFFTGSICFGQDTDPIPESTLEELFSLKAKMEKEGEIRENYTVHIFTGSRSDAKEALDTFKQKAIKHDAELVYEAPYFKVYVGQFRSRLQADRALLKIKNDYPNAVVLKP